MHHSYNSKTTVLLFYNSYTVIYVFTCNKHKHNIVMLAALYKTIGHNYVHLLVSVLSDRIENKSRISCYQRVSSDSNSA